MGGELVTVGLRPKGIRKLFIKGLSADHMAELNAECILHGVISFKHILEFANGHDYTINRGSLFRVQRGLGFLMYISFTSPGDSEEDSKDAAPEEWLVEEDAEDAPNDSDEEEEHEEPSEEPPNDEVENV